MWCYSCVLLTVEILKKVDEVGRQKSGCEHVEDVVLIRLLISCTVIYLQKVLCKALCAMSCYEHSAIEVLFIIIIIIIIIIIY